MKKQIKKTMLWAAAFLALASVSGGAVTLANADESKTISDVTLTMAKGASVRYMPSAEDATKGNGLRFGMTISTADAEWLDANYTVEYGMLIAPKGYTLSEENVFGESAIYDWATFDEEYEVWNYTASDKTRIINITGDSSKLVNDATENMKLFTGSIIDVKAANLTKEFQGVGYVAYTSDEETNYLFATANDNVRSMTYTAQLFLEDDTANQSEKTAVQGLYVDAVANQDTTVTVNTYQQASDGTYPTTPTTTTLTKKIGSTLTLADVTESGKTVDADKTTFASSPVYANGKTVVNVYYEDSLSKGLASASTNWASEKYMSYWTAVGSPADDFYYSDGIQVGSNSIDIQASATLSKDVVAAAIAKGYTHATVAVLPTSVSNTDFFNGANGGNDNYVARIDGGAGGTIAIALANFTDGIRVQAQGVWGGHIMKVTSLTFYNAVSTAIEAGFASEGTNWASADYVAVWGSVNGSAPSYDSTNNGVKYSFFDCGKPDEDNIIGYVTFNGNVLKEAAKKGYMKLSLTVNGIGYSSVWLNAGGPNGMATDKALARIEGGATGTIELNLADLLNATTGEYCLGMTIAGWWGGCSTVFTSLTFSK